MFLALKRMSQSFIWLLSTILTPLIALWRFVVNRIHLVREAEKFPGPRSYPLIGNALDPKSSKPEDLFDYGWCLFKSYGKTFRYYLGPKLFIHIMEFPDLEAILSSYKYLDKIFLYSFLRPWLGIGLLISTGEKWRSRRKMLTPAFHFKILDQFIPIFQNCSDVFVRQLRKHADGSTFNVYPLVELLTLDVICETAMGVTINAQTDKQSTYVKAVREAVYITCARCFQPLYYLDFIFHLSPMGRKYKKYLQEIHETTNKVILQRKEELELMTNKNATLDIDEIGRRRRVAFLDLLLLAARDGSLSDADIREEVDTFMFEGHDTTASAISFAIFTLSRHPNVQEKLLQELESEFDTYQPLKPSIQQLSEMKYMEMVIKEVLRLYPPVPLFNRMNSKNTRLANGLVMPKGCCITLSPFILHRHSDIYPHPDEFIPERFSLEEIARRHPYAYLPFSAGPRNCIGQRFAMLELKSALAKVVWNFRILPAPSFEPVLSWEITLKSVNGLLVRLEDRGRS